MTGATLGLAGFFAVIALIMLRMPVAIAMGTVGVLGVTFTTGWNAAGFMLGRSAFEAAFPYSLSIVCLLYTSPSPRDRTRSRMPSSA